MHLYLELQDTRVEILNPSMSTVREVADRLSTLSHKYRDALDTKIIYSNEEIKSSITYVTSLVDEAICMIQSECAEIESKLADTLAEINQTLISTLDDDNLLIMDGRDSVKVSMKIAGSRYEFEIRVRRDLIIADFSGPAFTKERSYEFANVNDLVDSIADLQKVVNELNQSLIQSVFSSMFE